MCLEKVEPLVFRTHQWLAGSSRLTPLLCNIKAFSANFQVSNIWQVKLACGYTIKKTPLWKEGYIYICIGRKYMYIYIILLSKRYISNLTPTVFDNQVLQKNRVPQFPTTSWGGDQHGIHVADQTGIPRLGNWLVPPLKVRPIISFLAKVLMI